MAAVTELWVKMVALMPSPWPSPAGTTHVRSVSLTAVVGAPQGMVPRVTDVRPTLNPKLVPMRVSRPPPTAGEVAPMTELMAGAW